MSINGNVNLNDGVVLEPAEVTTIELTSEQAALITYSKGITLTIPEANDEESFIPQHVMFLIGVYIMSQDDAFTEKMIRVGIDRLREAEALASDNAEFDD